MLKRFIAYYKPHRLMFALDMLASFFISAIGMVYPIVTNRMLNDLIPNKLYKEIIVAGLIVLALYVI
ncbi:MAG: ABC transporter ATP-binding protein, partial [Clostridia bacterium]|nr:ABC transporter ATP-binding protein [Clostridia bacterium]